MEEYRIITRITPVFGMGNPVTTAGVFYEAYHILGEPVALERGRVLLPCTPKEYANLRSAVGGNTVLCLRAEKEGNTFNAQDIKLCDSPTDEEKAIMEELAKPVTFTDRDFGEFVLDRLLNQFEGKLAWGKGAVSLYLREEADVETLRSFGDIGGLAQRAADFAAGEMLDLANDWEQDKWAGEKTEGPFIPLTPGDFARRIGLNTIAINGQGHYELWFDDDEIFWGHAVCVNGNLQDGFTRASMQG